MALLLLRLMRTCNPCATHLKLTCPRARGKGFPAYPNKFRSLTTNAENNSPSPVFCRRSVCAKPSHKPRNQEEHSRRTPKKQKPYRVCCIRLYTTPTCPSDSIPPKHFVGLTFLLFPASWSSQLLRLGARVPPSRSS